MGVGLLLARPPPGRPHPLLDPLYTGAGGTPRHKLIHVILFLAVCGAPATIILDNIVVVLRRSPATVEHQDRHHAIMLTELSLDTRLDRSSRDVIELNVCKNLEVP